MICKLYVKWKKTNANEAITRKGMTVVYWLDENLSQELTAEKHIYGVIYNYKQGDSITDSKDSILVNTKTEDEIKS